jgi:hypothetical protein
MHVSSIVTNIERITAVIKRTIIDNIVGNKQIALLAGVFADEFERTLRGMQDS